MSASSIEWTDKTWNPTVGCTKVSAGCKHCYAERQHARLTAMGQKKYAEPFRIVRPWPEHLAEPLTWKKPARIFVNSMSDLFHEDVPDEYIAAVFGVMAACPQHTFQVLTKRAERMARWFEWIERASEGWNAAYWCAYHGRRATGSSDEESIRSAVGSDIRWPLPNVWLGASVENQEQADERIPHLLRVPAAVRFLSCEPLLGNIEISFWLRRHVLEAKDGRWMHNTHPEATRVAGTWLRGVDWVIVGGESGHGARLYNLAWARSIIGQCRSAGVPVFHKQAGTRPVDCTTPNGRTDGHMIYVAPGFACAFCAGPLKLRDKKGGDPDEWPEELRVRQFPAVRP